MAFHRECNKESRCSTGLCIYFCMWPSKMNINLFSCEHLYFPLIHFAVVGTKITPELLQFVQRLVSSFGISLEQSSLASSAGVPPQEQLARRAQAATQDPAFQRLKAQFASDFDFRWLFSGLRIKTYQKRKDKIWPTVQGNRIIIHHLN